MAAHTVNGLALCAGVGTIELGIRLALGTAYRTVGYVERDTFAAAILVARMAEQTMDRAPIWDDVATFDGLPWRGKVDLITAGFPCQPFSQAGRKAGTNDDRWLWPDVRRVIADVEPALVFLENVPPVVKKGLPRILSDLAQLGFDAEWECLGADDCGAPQIRRRFWLLAYRDSDGLQSIRREPHHNRQSRHDAHRQGRQNVADTQSVPEWTGRARPQGAVCDTRRLWPPPPDDTDRWRANVNGPQPAVCRTSDGLAHRVDRLHAIGNGVVPLVAATAFIRLTDRALNGGDQCELDDTGTDGAGCGGASTTTTTPAGPPRIGGSLPGNSIPS